MCVRGEGWRRALRHPHPSIKLLECYPTLLRRKKKNCAPMLEFRTACGQFTTFHRMFNVRPVLLGESGWNASPKTWWRKWLFANNYTKADGVISIVRWPKFGSIKDWIRQVIVADNRNTATMVADENSYFWKHISHWHQIDASKERGNECAKQSGIAHTCRFITR